MKVRPLVSFVRPGVLDIVVRDDTVILGQVEPLVNDLRISGHRHAGYLRMSVYTETGVKHLGGRINGENRQMSVENAETLKAVVTALGMHEYFATASALLAIDARAREQVKHSRQSLVTQYA